jgi:hypothetical protein
MPGMLHSWKGLNVSTANSRNLSSASLSRDLCRRLGREAVPGGRSAVDVVVLRLVPAAMGVDGSSLSAKTIRPFHVWHSALASIHGFGNPARQNSGYEPVDIVFDY